MDYGWKLTQSWLRAASDHCESDSDRQIYRSVVEQVPQLGSLQLLSFENKVFQNNSLGLILRPNGSVEKLEYTNPKARGEIAANSALDLVEQWDAFSQSREQARIDDAAKRRKSELDNLNHAIEVLEARNKLDSLHDRPMIGHGHDRRKCDALTSALGDETRMQAVPAIVTGQACGLSPILDDRGHGLRRECAADPAVRQLAEEGALLDTGSMQPSTQRLSGLANDRLVR
ncbi:hypothetical protein [Stenotrophomonas maltophilia]|uniref:hypothetical protein n=1 Tax=Stenotrophomonas maltophilia TaxID=40324 RepID=UPI0040421A06